MNNKDTNINAAVIVAHPDDETLWASGMILMYREHKWTVATLCRQIAQALDQYLC